MSVNHPNQVRRRVGVTTILAAIGVVLSAGWLFVPGVILAWSPTATLGWYAATMVVPGVLAVWALRRAITDGVQVVQSIDGDTDWDELVAKLERDGLGTDAEWDDVTDAELDDLEVALQEWFPSLVLGVFAVPTCWLAVTGLAAIVPPPAVNPAPTPFAMALAGGSLCALVFLERRLRRSVKVTGDW